MTQLNKILSFTAGYVDTACFLALHGLFAAHVTGNFVTLGAALVSENHGGALAKLSALPMFCVTIILVKLVDQFFIKKGRSSYNLLLITMFILLVFAGLISVFYLPFPREDTLAGFSVGMLLISAMAIQNAMGRLYWAKEPPTTVMTGSTTQLMLDAAVLLSHPRSENKPIFKERFSSIFPTMMSFTIGCTIAALVYKFALIWLFALPPILMILIYWQKENYKKA